MTFFQFKDFFGSETNLLQRHCRC